MKINHNTDTLLGIIGITEEEVKTQSLKNFHSIREGNTLNDEQLIISLIHLVAAYDGHTLVVLPVLGTIYGMGTKEMSDISSQEFSYQLEAIIKYSDESLRDMITNTYFYTVLKNET